MEGKQVQWFIEPVWQNYSSMFREATTALDAKTGMEIAHHRMAALYFGISALESFLNLKMRDHLLALEKSHDEIHEVLRAGKLQDKIRKWPKVMTGKDLDLRATSIDRVLTINALRGDLTHQKNFWPEAFRGLSKTDPMDLVDLVAEFIVEFHHAKGEFFPYWVWGWNYLSPQRDVHDIGLLNETQMMHSLNYLGYRYDSPPGLQFEVYQREIMCDYAGYVAVAKFLRASERCEPKMERFPYQPKLCRRWWDPNHHVTCGFASPEAVRRAIEIDESYGQPKPDRQIEPEMRGRLTKMVDRFRPK